MRQLKMIMLAAPLALGLGLAACGGGETSGGETGGGGNLSGTIAIDGSSTVFPFAQAAAEQFQGKNPNVKITVGQSGTGGGFEKFCAGETQISDASRPIEPDEIKACKENGIRYKELQVASDGIAVVTNPQLEIDCLTVDQLKQLWEKGSTITNYSQLGSGTPSGKVSLYGPGTDSGTFDFFTEEINGEEGNTRKDYQPSEDDNVLVQGVAGDRTGLAYFGFSYYEQNRDKLNLVGIDDGSGCVKPDAAKIQSGDYKPLGRPIFMYPSVEALARPEVKAFMEYALASYESIAEAAQIVPMSAADDEQSKRELGS